MKNFLALSIVILSLTLAASCGRGEVENLILTDRSPLLVNTSDELAYVLDRAYIRREGIVAPDEDRLRDFIRERDSSRGAFSHLFRNNPLRQDEVSMGDARSSTRFLFSALAEFYAPYFFLGGDEVFLPVLDDIIVAIEAQQRWYVDDLSLLLHAYLSSVINDAHFLIHGQETMRFHKHHMFLNFDGRFNRHRGSFYCQESGLYIESVMLQCQPDIVLNVNDVLRLTVDESGTDFFYSPVVLLPAYMETPHYLLISFEDESSMLRSLKYQHGEFVRGEDWERASTSLEFIQEIPVITSPQMGSDANRDADDWYDRDALFLSFAEQLRDEPVIIMDLRFNGGGHPAPPGQWLYTLTSEVIPANSVFFSAVEHDTLYSYGILAHWADRYSATPFEYNHTIFLSTPDRIVSNNQLIVFLTCRFTASSAELMVDLAFNMENTLIIGRNTIGALQTSVGLQKRLPFTGLPLSFSHNMWVHPEEHFQESIGFAPDIWVQGDALTATLAMINNHLLTN